MVGRPRLYHQNRLVSTKKPPYEVHLKGETIKSNAWGSVQSAVFEYLRFNPIVDLHGNRGLAYRALDRRHPIDAQWNGFHPARVFLFEG